MRAAVTGASGFVGRHLVNALVARGVQVTAVTHHGKLAAQPPSVRVMQLDIHRPCDDPFNALGRPDVLFHLAWAGLPHYDSSHHLIDELPAQQLFLDACVRSGIRHVVVTGTCAEYGLASGALSEDHPLAPSTGYAKAKVQLAKHVAELCKQFGCALAWARIFYLFGPGQSPHAIYSQLQAAIAAGERVFDMSGGEQLRDYLPIEEAARLLVSVGLDAGDIRTVNICSGRPVALKNLVTQWIQDAHADIRPNLGRYSYSNLEAMAFWGRREKLNRILEQSRHLHLARVKSDVSHTS